MTLKPMRSLQARAIQPKIHKPVQQLRVAETCLCQQRFLPLRRHRAKAFALHADGTFYHLGGRLAAFGVGVKSAAGGTWETISSVFTRLPFVFVHPKFR
jgi:hypothetical protein